MGRCHENLTKGTESWTTSGVDMTATTEAEAVRGFGWCTDSPVAPEVARVFGLCVNSPVVAGGFGKCISFVAARAAGGFGSVVEVRGAVRTMSGLGRVDGDWRW